MSKVVGYGSIWYVANDRGDYYPDIQTCYDTRAEAQAIVTAEDLLARRRAETAAKVTACVADILAGRSTADVPYGIYSSAMARIARAKKSI